jgi:phage/plasmid-like protein (TIGR03299 family)
MVAAVTTRKGGFAEMAYVGAKPWHGQGQRLAEGAPIEEWVRQAGMDWRACRSRVRYGEGANQRVIEDQHVLFRSDTKGHLGIVSDSYRIVQPREVLEFFRDLVGAGGMRLETAGTLFGGRKFWALAEMGEAGPVVDGDVVKGKLLLATSLDGSMRTTCRTTTVRVVCDNTLTAAAAGAARAEVRVGHRSAFDPAAAKVQLGLARERFRETLEVMRRLAARPMHEVAAKEFFGELLAETKTVQSVTDVAAVQETKQFRRVMDLFRGLGKGASLPGVRGTAWGAVNAVTEYVDFHAQARSAGNRLDSAWFGRGEALKTAAFAKALALT